VRGADPVTVSDRGEALHGGAEQAAECLGLRLAKLRILGGHVGYRAVVLTELFSPAGGSTTSNGATACRGGVTVGGQCRRQRLDPLVRGGSFDGRLVSALQLSDLLPGELGDGARPGPLGQETQGARGQVVIGVLKGTAAGVGDRKQPGWPAAAAAAIGPGGPDLDHAVSQQVVQVTTDGSRRQA